MHTQSTAAPPGRLGTWAPGKVRSTWEACANSVCALKLAARARMLGANKD